MAKAHKLLLIALRASAVIALITSPVLLNVGPALAAPVNDDWPTSLHDVARAAGSSDTHFSASNAASIAQAWSYQTGGPIAATPTVTGGVAYFGSWDGYEYAVNASTGAFIWKTYLGVTNYNPICIPPSLGVSSPSTVQNGVVYLGGGDSYWYALDAATGNVLWKLYIGDSSAAGGNYNWAGPLINNGYAYIGVASLGDCPLVQGKLLKVNLASHQIENTLDIVPNGQTGGGIWTSPALDPATNTIFTATGTKNDPTQHDAQAFLAIDAGTMEIKDHWELPNSLAVLDSDFGTSTTLFTDSQGRNLVTAINKNGVAYAFLRNDLSAGPVWSQTIAKGGECPTCGESSVSSGAFGGGMLFLAGGNGQIGAQGYGGTVNALNPTTGQYIWQHATSGSVIGALAYANGLVFVSGGNVFEVLNAATGQTLYSYDTGSQLFAGPSIANGYIYTGNVAGKVFAFTNGTPITPPADPACPSGFTCQDIGGVTGTGNESLTSGNWSINGSGGGISGTADSFRLISQPDTSSGDVQIVAQMTSQQNTGANAQAGIMLRQSNDPGAPFYSVMIKPGNNLVIQYRSVIGGQASVIYSSNSLGKLPVYLMINRQGSTVQAAISTNGSAYTLIPGTNVSMVLPVTSLAGMAVSSSVNGTLGNAKFSHFSAAAPSITPASASDGSACPSGWTCRDVGNPNLAGGQSLAGSTWTVKAAGGDIWGTSDQFHFVSKAVPADGTVSARITGLPTTDTWAKSGVMLRSSGADGGAYYAAYETPDHLIHIQYRNIPGLSAAEITTGSGSLPQFIRVARSGTTFTAYTSPNGSTWTPLAGSTISLPALSGSILGGLSVTSHNSTQIGSATFDNVQIGTTAPAPPDLCPSGWSCGDIGFPTPIGDQVNSGGNWTITAGGGDIWGTYDTFHFVSQDMNGDGSLSAKVASQTVTGEWAKAGPMLRASNDPQAPYFAAFITPSHGIVVQWRSVQGGATGQASTSGTVPVYMKVARTGVNFSAYTSPDGNNWTLVAGSTVNIPSFAGTALAGLAADAYNTVDANTTNWSNVVLTGGGSGSGIPQPWTASAVGNPTPPGSASYNNFVFSVKGGGNDIWGGTDQSEYVNQNITGDGQFIARVSSQTNTDPWAKAGIMFKASTAAGSPYAAAMVTPGNGVHFQSNFNNDIAGTGFSFPNAWLRIDRDGSVFTAYQSADGTNWHRIGQTILNLPLNATIGLFVDAHNGGTSLGTATFDNVSFTPDGGGALPAPWQATDIGSTGLPGSSSFNNGVFTVKGAGSDIWASEDQLHFMYQSLSGDGTIVARMTALDNTDPWAKAGVMIKASTTAGSDYAMLAVTPGNQLHMQYSFSGDIGGSNYAFPNAWLKLTRAGNLITTYQSSDGQNWTQVGTTTLNNLPTNALIGVFVDAHHSGTALAAANFDSVNITQP